MKMNAYEEPAEQERKDSAAFNMALGSLQRLSNLRAESSRLRQVCAARLIDTSDEDVVKMLNLWKGNLDGQYCEVRGMVSLNTFEEGIRAACSASISRVVEKHGTTCYNQVPTTIGNRECKHFTTLFEILSNYDFKLSDIMQAHNLLMAGSDDPSRAFQGGRR